MALKTKKETSNISWNNYLSKFTPIMARICKSLRKLTSARTEWTWNSTYQKIFSKAKSIIKEDTCMKNYDETKTVHIEMDGSAVGL